MSDRNFTPGVWATLPNLTRTHFVPYLRGTRKPAIASLCGCAHTDTKHKEWDLNVMTIKPDTEGYVKPRCERCLAAQAKERGDQIAEELDKKTTHASEISMSLTVRQDDTPIAWVPVPDLEAVIEILKRQRPIVTDDVCRIKYDILDAAIVGLRRYIDEANERNEKTEVTTRIKETP